jgi:hypothetical protein
VADVVVLVVVVLVVQCRDVAQAVSGRGVQSSIPGQTT